MTKIWLVPNKSYLWVRTYSSLEDMREGAAMILKETPLLIRKSKKAAALFIGLNKRKGHIGYVLFNLDNLTHGIIAHEFAHAALFGQRKRLNDQYPLVVRSNKVEEKVMDQLQYAINQFSKKHINKIHLR